MVLCLSENGGNMLGIICAMQVEMDAVLKKADSYKENIIREQVFYQGKMNNVDFVVTVSSPGKVCAALSTAFMVMHYDLDYLINVGIAGGLSSKLHTLDTVVCDKIDQWDFDTAELGDLRGFDKNIRTCYADNYLNALIKKALPDALIGPIVTGDTFVEKDETKKVILDIYPDVLACEMEGGAVAFTAKKFHVPFTIIRTISDMGDGVSYTKLEQEACNVAPECMDKVTKELALQ